MKADNRPILGNTRVLLYGEEEASLVELEQRLRPGGMELIPATGERKAIQYLLQREFDVVIMANPSDPSDFLVTAAMIWPWLYFIIQGESSDPQLTALSDRFDRAVIIPPDGASDTLFDHIHHASELSKSVISIPQSQTYDEMHRHMTTFRHTDKSDLREKGLVDSLKSLGMGLAQLLPGSAVGILGLEESSRVLIQTPHEPVSAQFLERLKDEMIARYEAISRRALPEQSLLMLDGYESSDAEALDDPDQMCTVPIMREGELHGLVTLAGVQPGFLGRDDLAFLYHAAGQFATVLAALSHMSNLAIRDSLSGLYNRRHLEEELQYAWSTSQRSGQPLGVAILDIDHFKSYNDIYGHAVGDRILSEFAQLIDEVARVSDIIGRYGGDEFVVVLPQADLEAGKAFAERLLIAVRNFTFSKDSHNLRLTCSMGVADNTHAVRPVSGDQLLEQADQALYAAKRGGRDRVVFWSPDIPRATLPSQLTSGDGTESGDKPEAGGETEDIKGRILVVDDDEHIRKLLDKMLRSVKYHVETQETVAGAVSLIEEKEGQFDIVITDLNLKGESGFDLLEKLHSADSALVKIVITGEATMDNAIASLRFGAYDFIEKPIVFGQIIAVLDRALEYRRLLIENKRYQLYLEDMVQEKSAALIAALNNVTESYEFTLEALVAMLDAREKATGQHSIRVRDMAMVLAMEMQLPREEVETVRRGALMHDIGKIATPDAILLKTDSLTDPEWQIMKQHPQIGYDIIKGIPYLQDASDIVLSHQERWDGTGYPRALKGQEIALGARIFAIADAYDAMRSDRPYRKKLPHTVAVEEIKQHGGSQFDPEVVEAFLRCHNRFEEITERMPIVIAQMAT